jgi:hypothetical protein
MLGKFLASIIILLSMLCKNSNAQVLRCGHDLPALVTELYGFDELNFPEKHAIEHPTDRFGIRSGHVIPVVIHIVRHPDDPYIGDAAIRAQIEQLNTDFSARNEDRSRIPEAFRSVSSTSIIQFCLAENDPQGKPSSGVVRVETDVHEIGRKEALDDMDARASTL